MAALVAASDLGFGPNMLKMVPIASICTARTADDAGTTGNYMAHVVESTWTHGWLIRFSVCHFDTLATVGCKQTRWAQHFFTASQRCLYAFGRWEPTGWHASGLVGLHTGKREGRKTISRTALISLTESLRFIVGGPAQHFLPFFSAGTMGKSIVPNLGAE